MPYYIHNTQSKLEFLKNKLSKNFPGGTYALLPIPVSIKIQFYLPTLPLKPVLVIATQTFAA